MKLLLPKEEFQRRLSANLLLLRSCYGYTQSQLANIMCCKRSTYAYIEEGKSALSLYRLYLLCELYQLPPEAMWSDLQTHDCCHLRNRPEFLRMEKKVKPPV